MHQEVGNSQSEMAVYYCMTNYIALWKGQNYEDDKKTSGCQVLEGKGGALGSYFRVANCPVTAKNRVHRYHKFV